MNMTSDQLKNLAIDSLDNAKAKDITCLDIKPLTSMADYMIVATGTSNRHVRSIADQVIEASKDQGRRPIGVEGEATAEWILVDLGDVIVHIMLADTRKFYDLETLWNISPDRTH
jgi:ribosome-associated protein